MTAHCPHSSGCSRSASHRPAKSKKGSCLAPLSHVAAELFKYRRRRRRRQLKGGGGAFSLFWHEASLV